MAGAGFAGYIGWAKESSGGTPVSATDYVKALSENLTLTKDRFEFENIVGGAFYEGRDQAGVDRVNGDVVFAAKPEELGHFLLASMGVQSSQIVGDISEHIFTMRNEDWSEDFAQQPYTFEIGRDVTSAQQYTGCNVAAIGFNVVPNQSLNITATLIGKGEAMVTETSPTFVTSPTYPFGFDTCSVSIGGAANALLESFTVNIDNQLEGIPSLNNSTLVRGIRRTGPQLIRLSGNISFENADEYNTFRNQTERQFVFNMTRANSFSLTIDIPSVIYTTYPLGIGGRERQVVAFEGRGEYNTGSGRAISITLWNNSSFGSY